jgi:DNA segregation ATPase FtsK/SpoIIIE, S-DNA-T family
MSINDRLPFGRKAGKSGRPDREDRAEVIPLHGERDDRSAQGSGDDGEDHRDRGPDVSVTEEVERSPIVPDFLRRGQFGITVRSIAWLWWYRSRFHAVRVPVYAGRTGWYSLRGLLDLVNTVMRWWHWTHGWTLESLAVAAGRSGHHDALNVHREGKRTRAARGRILAVALAAGLAALLAAVAWAPWFVWPPALTAAVVALARRGRPDGRRIIGAAVVPTAYQPPTPETVTHAFASLRIPAINEVLKDGTGLSWVADIHRDGDGWALELDLPHGVTASDVIKRREALASGLRRPHSATWPEKVPHEHAGRLFLWIGRHDLSKVKPPAYPLLKSGTTDVFGEVPFATTPRGQAVNVPVFETNWVIGAAPGQGKTATVRDLAGGASLDPLSDLWIHEHSGKGDLEPLAQVCHRYTSGLDDEAIAYAAESIRKLRSELDRRSAVFKKLPREAKPDGKVTRELAADRKLGLRPIVAIWDEVQNLFLHPKYGPIAVDDMAYVMRLGRAYGIVVVLSTQRPDSHSLPPAVGALAVMRFCLKVADQVSNDMVLGTGAYKSGFRANEFRHDIDAGLGWLRGGADPQAVRTYYLDLNDTARIAARARAMRAAAGALSGYALGETDDTDARSFAADVLAVFGEGERNLHTATIATRLASHLPGVYGETTQDAVGSQLRALGIPVKDVRERGGANRKGVERAAVETVAEHAQNSVATPDGGGDV